MALERGLEGLHLSLATRGSLAASIVGELGGFGLHERRHRRNYVRILKSARRTRDTVPIHLP